MSTNPIDASWETRYQQQLENRSRFETFRNMSGEKLPAPVVMERPEGVFVTVADIDDLTEWLTVFGGVVHRGPVFEGMQTYTLHLVSDGWGDGRAVPVQVSVVTLADEPVMHTVLEAVAA